MSDVKFGSIVRAKYCYLADGSKLRVRDAGSNGFDYLGSLTYTSNSLGLQLESAAFGDGVIRVTGTSQEINYFLTDHLGSVRVIVDKNGAVKERNDYYAFGAKHIRGDYPQSDNRYDYNGKEEQTTGYLKFLDYGARMYDGALGRWFNVDPLTEKAYEKTPYHYCSNNPVNRIDPDGMIDYGVYGNGKFTIIPNGSQNDPFDRLWYLGDNASVLMSGTITTGFLSQFAKAPVTAFNGHYGTTSIAEDAFNVFKFLADQTSVEWAITGYKDENYVVSTSNKYSYIIGRPSHYNELDMQFDIHSHPTPVSRNGADPSGSMNPDGSWLSHSGDMYVLTKRFNNFLEAGKSWPHAYPKHYIYNVPSKGLYFYDHTYKHHTDPQKRFVKTINSGADFINRKK